MTGSPRVLVLEPNRFHALMLRRTISEAISGCVVVLFESRDSFVAELNSNRYDAIVTDLISLSRDGLRDLLKGRSRDQAIVLTGHVQNVGEQIEGILHLAKEGDFHQEVAKYICQRLKVADRVDPSDEQPSPSFGKDEPQALRLAAGSLAHKINNPLMMIMGETELLLTNGYLTDPAAVRKVRIIQSSTRRIIKALEEMSHTPTSSSGKSVLVNT